MANHLVTKIVTKIVTCLVLACSFMFPTAYSNSTNDPSKIYKSLKTRIDECKNDAPLCLKFAQDYEQGDYGRAKLLEKACSLKNQEACNRLGEEYHFSALRLPYEEKEKKLKLLITSCDLGYKQACFNALGELISINPENYKMKEDLSTKGCELGHSNSCAYLGGLHVNKHAANPSLEKAAKYFEKSCDSKEFSSWGCTELGRLYNNGLFFKKNHFVANDYFQKSCFAEDMHTEACSLLGDNYSQGLGVRKSNAKANELYSRACEDFFRGGPSCYKLGVNLLKGIGVAPNTQQAIEFFGQACDRRYQPGCDEYARLTK